jgi:hypothetical protein
VGLALPVDPGVLDESKVGLVHERRRLQRVARPLAAQIARRAAAQLVIDQGYGPIRERPWVRPTSFDPTSVEIYTEGPRRTGVSGPLTQGSPDCFRGVHSPEKGPKRTPGGSTMKRGRRLDVVGPRRRASPFAPHTSDSTGSTGRRWTAALAPVVRRDRERCRPLRDPHERHGRRPVPVDAACILPGTRTSTCRSRERGGADFADDALQIRWRLARRLRAPAGRAGAGSHQSETHHPPGRVSVHARGDRRALVPCPSLPGQGRRGLGAIAARGHLGYPAPALEIDQVLRGTRRD